MVGVNSAGGYVWTNGTYTQVGIAASTLTAINDKGIAVGNVNAGKKSYGFTFTPAKGKLKKLVVNGEKATYPAAINRGGAITGGYAVKHQRYGVAFLLEGSTATILDPPTRFIARPSRLTIPTRLSALSRVPHHAALCVCLSMRMAP